MSAVWVIVAVSGSLLMGALWGVYGRLNQSTEGILLAVAGGALMLSLVLELILPATELISVWIVILWVFMGALLFTLVDQWLENRSKNDQGGGLLAAIVLDGLPENLALGVAMIATQPIHLAALSGSIILSNLPEAASGAKKMVEAGHGRVKILVLWGVTALLLVLAALAGYFFMADVAPEVLAMIKCFAAGAVVASLSTEVLPKAYREDSKWAGMATTLGFALALWLNQLGN